MNFSDGMDIEPRCSTGSEVSLPDPREYSVGTLESVGGNTYVVDFDGNKKLWILYKTKGEREKIYEVHFNMSRPYTVRMTSKNAIIYDSQRRKHAYVLPNYTQVFVGSGLYQFKKELNKKVLSFPESAKGNAILFLLKQEQDKKYPYVFVGEKLFTFFSDEPVIDFKSPIVGADVPYPSAETQNDVYLLMSNESYKIPKTMIPNDVEHVYDWFYGLTKQQKKSLKKFKIKIN